MIHFCGACLCEVYLKFSRQYKLFFIFSLFIPHSTIQQGVNGNISLCLFDVNENVFHHKKQHFLPSHTAAVRLFNKFFIFAFLIFSCFIYKSMHA